MTMRAGVLALQGDFEAHVRVLGALGAEVRPVRRVAELSDLDGLVMPGGESTTMLNLMADEDWFGALRRFHDAGGAILGTCAGAILLAREVENPPQPSLGLLDATVVRNAYGRQVDSFEATLDVPELGGAVSGVFIRAPRFTRLGPAVEVLGTHRGEPVVVREGRILAMTFHPELAGEARLHAGFIDMARGSVAAAGRFS